MYNNILDVKGLKVGQVEDKEGLTGCTVVICKNTTIGIVATNAKLNKGECKKISQMAHNGYAKAIFPIHTPHDGDTIFTMATGEVETDITLLGSLATEVVEKSIINAIKNADSIGEIRSYKDIAHNQELLTM